MNDQNLNNYHWTNMNVSNWVKTQITTKLEALGYKASDINIKAEINNRMKKLTLVYFYTIKAEGNNKWLKLHDFDGYCDLSDIYGNCKDDILSFFSFIKYIEKNSIETFENKQYTDPEKTFTKKHEYDFKINSSFSNKKPEQTFHSKSTGKADLKVKFDASFDKNEFISFLTTPSFVSIWTNGQYEANNDEISLFGKYFIKTMPDSSLKFKLSNWNEWSSLEVADSAKGNILLEFKGIPSGSEGSIRSFWISGIVNSMCRSFGFALKSVE